MVQSEIDLKFPDKKINLSQDFYFTDIFVYKDTEQNSLNYELEYYWFTVDYIELGQGKIFNSHFSLKR